MRAIPTKAKAKEVVNTFLRHVGYELRRIPKTDETLPPGPEEFAHECVRYPPLVNFSPWARDEDFLRRYSGIDHRTCCRFSHEVCHRSLR